MIADRRPRLVAPHARSPRARGRASWSARSAVLDLSSSRRRCGAAARRVAVPRRSWRATARAPRLGVGRDASTASGVSARPGRRRPPERRRVVLPQRRAQRVGLPVARPDQHLVGPGEHLDRLDDLAVAGDRAMVVPVGAHQVGQQLGVAGIGLRARDVVAVAIAGGGHRVDREHLIARRDERGDEQAPVGLDPDDHLGRIFGMRSDQLVETGRSPRRPRAAGLAAEAPALGVLRRARRGGPRPSPLRQRSSAILLVDGTSVEPEDTGSVLMVQCSRHDIPPAVEGDLTDRPGHDLDVGLEALAIAVLTGRRLGDQPHSLIRRGGRSPLGQAVLRQLATRSTEVPARIGNACVTPSRGSTPRLRNPPAEPLFRIRGPPSDRPLLPGLGDSAPDSRFAP